MQWWQRKLLSIDVSVSHTINHYFIVHPNVVQRAGQFSLPQVAISKTERNRTTNIKPMSSSYNTPWIKHKLVVSIYSNTETSLAMSTLAMSSLAFSVAPLRVEHRADWRSQLVVAEQSISPPFSNSQRQRQEDRETPGRLRELLQKCSIRQRR